MRATILEGDCRETLKELPAESIHTAITSPPYFQLRSYDTARWEGGDTECDHGVRRWEGPKQTQGAQSGHAARADRLDRQECACGARRVDLQIGLEADLDAYLAALVAVFREVWRVLRKDGTLWVNMGDSYAGSWGAQSREGCTDPGRQQGGSMLSARQIAAAPRHASRTGAIRAAGLKPKDLIGVPWRLAFALQQDGWWLRQAITWCKPAPMPESTRDRCTSATEMLFMLARAPMYFYDAQAIAEPCVSEHGSGNGFKREARLSFADEDGARGSDEPWTPAAGTRNRRNWWVLNSEAYPGDHFAVFPQALVRPCVLAGTSAAGCCPHCGAPWQRVTEKERHFESGSGRSGRLPEGKNGAGLQGGGATLDVRRGPVVSVQTTGWNPTCRCPDHTPVPCRVLDPFAGTGTTAVVALPLGREAVLCELSPRYITQIRRRLERVQLPLPALY